VYAAGLLFGAVLGLALPALGSAFEVLVYPVLGVLLYATFLQVPSLLKNPIAQSESESSRPTIAT
jgi:hypothetical protein